MSEARFIKAMVHALALNADPATASDWQNMRRLLSTINENNMHIHCREQTARGGISRVARKRRKG